ncbi:dihydroneopterin aldolase [Prochlorococcus sp. MIT 1341]|uniref:dihydroneopterin aldolase n=1 Tax=Prochlorococcus sp. MIT 1341 TaxID=3096221 RepID=UPI002A74E280|nr:dihydroneopterin aldolase [Prochlorococcus sp. MIT 1341]
MKSHLLNGVIHVCDVNLWAHVGLLEEEQRDGQWFSLDFSLKLNLDLAAKDDDIEATADYSLAIKALQQLSFDLTCFTIEHFSDLILTKLEDLYGYLPMRVRLTKCSPPLYGFHGNVSIERTRNCYYKD